MADMFFKRFVDAASYAKRLARESGVSVKLERTYEEWVVFDPNTLQPRDSQPDLLPALPPRDHDAWARGPLERVEDELARERREREQEQADYDDQKAYGEAIGENTPPRLKEATCEACGRPLSFCRCGD